MRRLLLLTLLAALFAACGGDGGDDGTEGVASGDLVVDVEVPDPLAPGEVVFTITVENHSDDDVTLEFSSGQRADVQLLDVEPGEYELVATVTATNEDLSVSRQVAVEPRPR